MCYGFRQDISNSINLIKNKFINNIPYLKTMNNELIMFWARSFWSPYFKKLNSAHYSSLIKAQVSESDSTDFSISLNYKQSSNQQEEIRWHLYTKLRLAFYYTTFQCFEVNVSIHSRTCSKHLHYWSYIKGEHLKFSRLPLSFKVHEKLY